MGLFSIRTQLHSEAYVHTAQGIETSEQLTYDDQQLRFCKFFHETTHCFVSALFGSLAVIQDVLDVSFGLVALVTIGYFARILVVIRFVRCNDSKVQSDV